VVAGEVSHLVRENRLELLGRERVHQRQTDQQIVALPAEQAQPGHLHDGGVVIVGQEHVVKSRGCQRGADPVECLVQPRGLGPLEREPLGWRDPHPERAYHGIKNDCDRQRELAGESAAPPHLGGKRHQTDEEANQQREDREDVDVAQRREATDLGSIGSWAPRRAPLQPGHQGSEFGVVHRAVPDGVGTARCARTVPSAALAARPREASKPAWEVPEWHRLGGRTTVRLQETAIVAVYPGTGRLDAALAKCRRTIGRVREPQATTSKPAAANAALVPVHANGGGRSRP
jgi:hypothetical protein